MNLRKDKLKNLILYVCNKTDPQNLGATKLDKIMWFSDILAFLTIGDPITGETYVRKQFGPWATHFYQMIDELKAEDKLIVRDVNFYGRQKREYIPLVSANLDLFTANEISIVDDVANDIALNFTAVGISDLSHDRIWEMANIGEEIPYEAIFAVRLGEIDEKDIQWAENILEALPAA